MNTLHQYTKNLVILFVEDDENIIYEASQIFDILFKSVTVCKNGIEGLKSYRSKENFYDIVLTDINMPYMDGLEMIKHVLDINPAQHIVVLSAQDDSISLRELINLSIDSFLLKPFEIKQLKQTLLKVSKNISNEKHRLEYKQSLITSNEYLEKTVYKRTKELKDSLFIDSLTDLQNRSALINSLDLGEFTLLALIDIDRLKFINSLYGTEIGNIVIEKFAKFIQEQFKETSYSIFKTSVDEFAICSKDKQPCEFDNCIKTLNTKITNLALFIDEIQDEIIVDATIGYTLEVNNLSDGYPLLIQSDAALKHAKQNNKSIVSYDQTMNEINDIQNIMHWKQIIKTAYENDNFVPVFQPIVNSKAEIVKYETLMRIRKIDDGKTKLILPYQFLDIAIMTKKYAKLSQMIVSKALEIIKFSKHTLSINLTYSDIQNSDMIVLLESRLQKSEIGNRLIIEIVESEDIENYNLLEDFIQKFRQYGVRIAIDDFGSGFSNFKNIIGFKPDYLKIDGSLIKDIYKNHDSLAIVKSITEFAHILDIKVIAEYVHSAEVLKVLKEIGVDEFQGFYFYEPALEFVNEKISI